MQLACVFGGAVLEAPAGAFGAGPIDTCAVRPVVVPMSPASTLYRWSFWRNRAVAIITS